HQHRRRADRPAQPGSPRLGPAASLAVTGSFACSASGGPPRMIAAIVPAAGRSLRMERPKLTLPLGDTTVIAHVVTALRQGGAGPVLGIARPAEARGAEALAAEAERAGATVVVAATRPADMRGSVELGLDHLRGDRAATTVLIAPGDCVGASTALVAAVVER